MNIPDSDQKNHSSIIIICGPPRSGTTWLYRELCGIPGAFPFLPECTYLTQQIALYHRTQHFGDRQRTTAYFGTENELREYFRANTARLIDLVVRLNRKDAADILILKDPDLSLYLADVKELLPPHKLIVLMRDPRDVLASMKIVTMRKQQHWNARKEAEDLMNYYYQIGHYRPHFGTDSILVHYEDLVRGKTTALQEFLQLPALELGLSDNAVSDVKDRLDPADPFYSELYLKPTTTEKVGSFASILTKKEIRDFETEHSGVIKQWGYPLFSLKTQVMSAFARAIRGSPHAGKGQ